MAGQPENLLAVPTGRHGLPVDVVAAHQRERILTATTELVAKRGYRGTSIDHIVKAARVGYVAFYELFEGKEDCFLAAFDRIVAETREQLAAAVSPEQSWPQQVCAVLGALLELIAAEPFRARIVLAETQTGGKAAVGRHDALLDEVALALREGRALHPHPEKLPPTLEEAIVGGVAWLLHQRLIRGELEGVRELFGELALIVLEPYLGAAETQALIAAHSGARAPA
jgi:AcrR family transcriptional regulator